jgi:hypothetical protein
MSKAQRDADIERIVDIAVASENARLAGGGEGPGDTVDLSRTIEHDGQHYLSEIPRKETVELPARRQSTFDSETSDTTDDYRSLIEESAGVDMNCAGPPEPQIVLGTTHTPERVLEIHRVVDQIRKKVASYPENIRVDVGYLLEVVDAYKQGRM